jgi:DNA-binding PadR family transcriptional regulator
MTEPMGRKSAGSTGVAGSGTSGEPLTAAVFHVLLALADGAVHGYAIMQAVESTSGVMMGPGTVYGTLSRLEQSGRVEAATTPRGADPRRRYWRLTSEGRSALRSESVRLAALGDLLRAKKLAPARGGR